MRELNKYKFINGKLESDVELRSSWRNRDQIEQYMRGEKTLDEKGQELTEIFFQNNGIPKYKKTLKYYSPKSVQKFKLTQLDLDIDFSNPKQISLMKFIFSLCTINSDIILDHFAGSGTTGHAVLKLNKEDKGKRKFILVEMGEYFDTVLKPRIAKVIYSDNWKNGKPQDNKGSPKQIIKYQYLEQYEDTLENIEFKQTDLFKSFIDRDTLFRYELDKGTEESSTFLGADVENNFLDFYISALDENLKPIRKKVDLIESFNYIIGMWVEKYIIEKDEGRKYIGVKGRVSGERVFVVWRDPKDIDPGRDRKFIERKIIRGERYSKLYVNSDCAVPGYLHIFDEWRKRMW